MLTLADRGVLATNDITDSDKLILTFSKHQPSGLMLSIGQFVHVFVCLCVRVFTFFLNFFFLLFKRLLPPLPEVGCPILLEIRTPWGKVM